MDKKTTGWLSYITIVGWLVAYFTGDKEGAKFHLNQSLIVWIGYLGIGFLGVPLSYIPVIGRTIEWAVGIFLFALWVMGLINAIKEEEKELPLVGKIQIL